MKGESYLHIEKKTTPVNITYYFYSTNKSEFYTKGDLLYYIVYNRFHLMNVFDGVTNQLIGKIRGRNSDWNYESMPRMNSSETESINVILTYFASLGIEQPDLRITCGNGNKYKLEKPKARGFARYVLDFDY